LPSSRSTSLSARSESTSSCCPTFPRARTTQAPSRRGPKPLADQYRQLIGTAPALLAFQTVAELRFATIRAGWGDLRRHRPEHRLTVVQPDDYLISTGAQLRAHCQRIVHALGDEVHDSDRWIAATALRLQCPLASHDGVFDQTPAPSAAVVRSAGRTGRAP
jgi:predicted nucleic acid-binding protein